MLVIVTLSAPAWLVWVFLPKERQEMVLAMVKAMGAWACYTPEAENGSPSKEQPQPPERRKPRKAGDRK